MSETAEQFVKRWWDECPKCGKRGFVARAPRFRVAVCTSCFHVTFNRQRIRDLMKEATRKHEAGELDVGGEGMRGD